MSRRILLLLSGLREQVPQPKHESVGRLTAWLSVRPQRLQKGSASPCARPGRRSGGGLWGAVDKGWGLDYNAEQFFCKELSHTHSIVLVMAQGGPL